MALKLSHYKTQPEALTLLSAASKSVTRTVPDRELESAVENAFRIHRENGGRPPSAAAKLEAKLRKWPPRLLHKIDRIVRDGPRQADGMARSPVKFDLASRHTEEVIDTIYPRNNPLLCVARRGSWDFTTRPREDYRGRLHLASLIVPSPMSALTGLTQGRKQSAHALTNVGPRHFLVTEFDFVKVDEAGKPTIWTPLIEGW